MKKKRITKLSLDEAMQAEDRTRPEKESDNSQQGNSLPAPILSVENILE